MVTKTFAKTLFTAAAALIAVLFSLSSYAKQPLCTKGDGVSPSLCRIKLPAISHVTIKKNGAGQTPKGSVQDYDKCEKFTLTPSNVKRYFQKTKLFNETNFHLYKDVTPCYASGTLIFADGRKATWDIDAHQNGTLKIGKQKEIYLLCDTCNFKPW